MGVECAASRTCCRHQRLRRSGKARPGTTPSRAGSSLCSNATDRAGLRARASAAPDRQSAGKPVQESDAQRKAGKPPPTEPRRSPFVTGGRFGTTGSARRLVPADRLPLTSDQQVVLVRHGLTTWNVEKRIQGSSDESHLTEFGRAQAVATRKCLQNFPFGACLSSPISRGREFAEIVWQDRKAPFIEDNNLREAYLGSLQGLSNAAASEFFPDAYRTWRQNPSEFVIDGRCPIDEVFECAQKAWEDVILHPSDVTLVVSHKSVLRAMVCTALGLDATGFRALDVHNGGVSIFWVNKSGEAMLQNLNLTAHLSSDILY